MNILEITDSLGLGGTEKTLQLYCKFLNKAGANVYAASFQEGGVRERYINNYAREVLEINGGVDRLKNYLKKKNINVLHWHKIPRDKKSSTKEIAEILSFCRSKNILTVETSPFSLFSQEVDKFIDIRIFVSRNNLLKYLYKYGKKVSNKTSLQYLYNPLDIDELNTCILHPSKRAKVRNKYGIEENDFVIGRVGRPDPWKWDDHIINVVPYLINAIPNLKVVIRSIPKNKIKKIRRMGLERFFILLPQTSSEIELAETYQIIDILLHTSRIGECNSVAMNEAMFYGLPIITNSTDFMQFTLFDRDNGQIELVKNGENGFIENSIKGMAQKIILLNMDKRLYGLISKRNHVDAFNKFQAKKIIDIFNRLIIQPKSHKMDIHLMMEQYKRDILEENILNLLKTNVHAILDLIKIKYVEKN